MPDSFYLSTCVAVATFHCYFFIPNFFINISCRVG